MPFLCFKLKIVAAAGQLGCRATCQIPSTEATLYSLADVSCNACGCCRALDTAKPQVMVQWCSRLCRRWSIVGTMAVSILIFYMCCNGSIPCGIVFAPASLCQLPLLQGEVAAVQQAMQKRVEDAVADAKAQSATLRESREKNVHFSARVVALNSRVAQLTKQVRWQHAVL